MTKEDKQLLLQDLCVRLPYGIIGKYSWKGNEPYNRELTGNLYDKLNSSWDSTEDSKFIPYLRPMSSMTEEEEKEICQFMKDYNLLPGANRAAIFCGEITDWLNTHYFDYRGLIEKGLAIEVTKENNPYKE